MARLLIQTEGFGNQVIELRLGVNKLGRSPQNDLQIEHSTVSARHCDLEIDAGQLVVRDCHSTNGTFVNGSEIEEARLGPGETFRVGDVELLVDNTDIDVNIPKFQVAPQVVPPIVLSDGSMLCKRHPKANVTHQCTFCREVMCSACVRRLRRRGGKALELCVLCSHKVVLVAGDKKKKRSLLGFLQKTIKMPLLRHASSEETVATREP